MAENTVVKEQLTSDMIEAGARLTQKLDESGLPIPVSKPSTSHSQQLVY